MTCQIYHSEPLQFSMVQIHQKVPVKIKLIKIDLVNIFLKKKHPCSYKHSVQKIIKLLRNILYNNNN